MEHEVDTLIIGAGISGIGVACHLTRESPGTTLRDPRTPPGHRRHLGPVPVPRHPLGLGHVQLRLPLPAVARDEDPRRRRPRSASTSRPPRPSTACTSTSASAARCCARAGPARRAGGPSRRATRRPARSRPTRSKFLLGCTGYYNYDAGYRPDFPGEERFAGPIVHPQHWPEDLDYAGKRVVIIGSGATAITLVPAMAATAEHVTMLQRSPTYVVEPADRRRAVRKAAQGAAVGRGLPARPRPQHHHPAGVLPADARAARHGPQARAWQRCSARSGRTSTCGTSRPTTTRGTSGCASCPNGDLFKALRRGKASIATDHIETFTETGHPAEVRRGDPGRHHRDRDRPGRADAGRRQVEVDGAPVARPRKGDLQGRDARRRPERGDGDRVHQRVVDAQGRHRRRVLLPPGQPHEGQGLHRGRRPGTAERPRRRRR